MMLADRATKDDIAKRLGRAWSTINNFLKDPKAYERRHNHNGWRAKTSKLAQRRATRIAHKHTEARRQIGGGVPITTSHQPLTTNGNETPTDSDDDDGDRSRSRAKKTKAVNVVSVSASAAAVAAAMAAAAAVRESSTRRSEPTHRDVSTFAMKTEDTAVTNQPAPSAVAPAAVAPMNEATRVASAPTIRPSPSVSPQRSPAAAIATVDSDPRDSSDESAREPTPREIVELMNHRFDALTQTIVQLAERQRELVQLLQGRSESATAQL